MNSCTDACTVWNVARVSPLPSLPLSRVKFNVIFFMFQAFLTREYIVLIKHKIISSGQCNLKKPFALYPKEQKVKAFIFENDKFVKRRKERKKKEKKRKKVRFYSARYWNWNRLTCIDYRCIVREIESADSSVFSYFFFLFFFLPSPLPLIARIKTDSRIMPNSRYVTAKAFIEEGK